MKIYRNNYFICLFALATSFIIGGCGTTGGITKKALTPLQEYFSMYKFSSFDPPRSGDGVGTIISFNEDGEETVIASRNTCLPESSIPSLPQSEQYVTMLSGSYKTDRSNNSELNLSESIVKKFISPGFDLNGVFKIKDVKEIEIKWKDPFRDRIERIKAKNYARQLAENSSCLEELLREGNLVIHTVIGAKGVTYKFIGEGGQELKVNAEIVSALNADNKFKNIWEGKLGFEIDKEILLGYRAWKAAIVPGALTNNIQLKELSDQEVNNAKMALKVNK